MGFQSSFWDVGFLGAFGGVQFGALGLWGSGSFKRSFKPVLDANGVVGDVKVEKLVVVSEHIGKHLPQGELKEPNPNLPKPHTPKAQGTKPVKP